MSTKIIYTIRNNVNGKVYVGSTENAQKRFATHINELRTGKHRVKELQEDFDKYGESAFSLSLVCEDSNLGDVSDEYRLMAAIKSYDPRFGYNTHDPKFIGIIDDQNKLVGTVSQRIKAKREELGLSKDYVAEKAGLPMSGKHSLMDIEQAGDDVSIKSLVKISKALGVSCCELCGNSCANNK